MSYQKLFVLDRASFLLDAQLLSSQTSGTFTGSSASALGTQSWNMLAGNKAVLTVENEQILLSAMSILGGVVTCTIDTRGYNGTTAATHSSGASCEMHLTKAHVDVIGDELANVGKGFTTPVPVTTVSSSSVHTLAGDYTSLFTIGRVFQFQISGVWYRALIRSSSYGGGTTTINLTGDGLPGSGIVTSAAFEFIGNVNAPVDYQLLKHATNFPAQNPPSGYSWLFVKAGAWFAKDSSGGIKFLGTAIASVLSSSGVITCDWSLANLYYITLTENITGLTHQNGVTGEAYILRIKQHASSAKTVALGTGGGTRFSATYPSYVASTGTSEVDYVEFRYNAEDTKYDIVNIAKGASGSPTAAGLSDPLFGDGSDGDLSVGSNTTLNPTYKTFQYNTLNVQNTFTLDFGANFQNKFVIMKVKGACTIAGTLSVKGLGATGGTAGGGSGGGSPSSGGGGNSGNNGLQIFDNTAGGGGSGGTDAGTVSGKGGGGGGGGGYVGTATAGSAGSGSNGTSTGGSAGTGRGTQYAVALSQRRGTFLLACGNGGGGGGGGSGNTGGKAGGDGASGGGCLILLVGGDLNFSGTIDARGNNGNNGAASPASGAGGGGGGGGSGGSVAAFYKTATSTAGTINVTAGSGGSGSSGNGSYGAGGSGGAGSNGESIIEQYLGLL